MARKLSVRNFQKFGYTSRGCALVLHSANKNPENQTEIFGRMEITSERRRILNTQPS